MVALLCTCSIATNFAVDSYLESKSYSENWSIIKTFFHSQCCLHFSMICQKRLSEFLAVRVVSSSRAAAVTMHRQTRVCGPGFGTTDLNKAMFVLKKPCVGASANLIPEYRLTESTGSRVKLRA